MNKGKLSKNEKLTLYGLVKYPNYNDREIAEKIGLKMSTVTAIKNRLKRNNVFKTIRVPIFQNLGCEIFEVSYAKLNLTTSQEARVRPGKKLIEDFAETFFAIFEPDKMFSMSVSKNFTESKKNIDRFMQVFSEHNFLEGDNYTFIHFPFEMTKIHNFFDMSNLLKRHFALDLSLPEERDEERNVKVIPDAFTKIQKKVYHGLVSYPDLLDNRIARKIGVTRQSVTKMRKRFEADGLIKSLRLANLKTLGFEILVLIHVKYNPKSPPSKRSDCKKIWDELPIFFNVSTTLEGVMLAAVKNYRDYQQFMNRLIKYYKENEIIKEEPVTYLFSIEDMDMLKCHVYVPIVKKIFNIKEE